MLENVQIIKKDGTVEAYNPEKIIKAVGKSADRIMIKFTDEENDRIVNFIETSITMKGINKVPISEMHKMVEAALERVNSDVCKSYRDYRNYKKEFVHMLDDVYKKSQAIRYIGDKENANTDSTLVATKRSLIFNELNKQLYNKFFLTVDEKQAHADGYIYIHDMSARLDTMNCCLFDMGTVLKGGFEMGNVWYNEPKTLDTAFDVMGDVILSTAAQQYGGFTVPEVDKVLEPYAKKSYKKYYDNYIKIQEQTLNILGKTINSLDSYEKAELEARAEEFATSSIRRDFEQGWQGIEYKLNTVGSSRGDYPFVTMTFGLGTSKFEKMCSIVFLQVHKKGEGKKGFEKPVLFPKLVFLYDENLHGDGCECEDVFEEALLCSAKTMYPDYLSLTGEGYVPEMYKKYGTVVSPMGCRAFLSPWYERGGFEPADENDKAIFVGRFNIGVVSLHLPMILAKARRESKDFYEVLDYYMEMIRGIHKRTYAYLGNLRASVNPMAFCEGGFLGGHLKYDEKIESILKPMTASFGITALNELQELYNGKDIYEDGQFALEVMQYINDKVNKFKKEDGWLYAIYGTPAESLCGKQIEQFRKEFGIIDGVSDKTYVTNSFHVPVWKDVTPIEKQDSEERFFNLLNGGKIQYVRYQNSYNIEAIKSLVRRAMKKGFYEGVNLQLSYCNHCGTQYLDNDVPKDSCGNPYCKYCNSTDITMIDRMNGYLAYSRVRGTSRMNKAKMDEINDRVSM